MSRALSMAAARASSAPLRRLPLTAKVELAVLRQRDSIVSSVVGAVDSAAAAPTIASQKAAESGKGGGRGAGGAGLGLGGDQAVGRHDGRQRSSGADRARLPQTTAAELGAAQARVEAEPRGGEARGLGMD